MATLYTESLNALIQNMVDGNFVRAKYVRRAIDNATEAKNLLILDRDMLKRFNDFKRVALATDKKEKTCQQHRGSYCGKTEW